MDTNLVTRYFLKQITLDTPMSDIATLGVSIRTKAGYILYINGEEVVRHRLPSYISFRSVRPRLGALLAQIPPLFLAMTTVRRSTSISPPPWSHL